jgi:shikimate kinase
MANQLIYNALSSDEVISRIQQYEAKPVSSKTESDALEALLKERRQRVLEGKIALIFDDNKPIAFPELTEILRQDNAAKVLQGLEEKGLIRGYSPCPNTN